jgi:N-methylhydantoinase A/oxoprolinase/acetone carboxylase beta subunit
VRIGTDIGGTFTDFVAIDDASGALHLEKTLTTPKDPSQGIFAGLELLARNHGASLAECATLVHGTTLVINALIERKGSVTALLTTRGFRDVLEMRNELRYDVYDLQIEYPAPLVPRALRLEVAERTSAQGKVLVAPGREEIGELVRMLRKENVTSVAVCLLNSFANPANEKAIGAMLAELAPELSVSLSSEVLPQVKEYERFSTTAANAYVRPLVDAYLARIGEGLGRRGFRGELYVMQSGGGVLGADVARDFPIRILESGPAGGVVAAQWWGALIGEQNLLCFDMGGTTAKLCAVARGEALVAEEYEAARVYRFKRGSGFAVSVPVFDLLEIGTGGGSIARVDHLGLLKVGPQSAGAAPGPACYGLGGTQPTVTDADVALGYLDPEYFLGGSMRLQPGLGLQAISSLGKKLDLGTEGAAYGIHEVANEDMASAARLHLAERGEDAGAMTMIAYGGAGPVHAYGLARKLGLSRLIVPPAAGVMSALGMLVEDLAIDRVRTQRGRLADAAPGELEKLYEEMLDEAAELLKTSPERLACDRIADMRYRGQGYNVRVHVPQPVDVSSIRIAFETQYRLHYGRVYPDVDIELVNLRIVARRAAERAFVPPRLPAARADIMAARKGTRSAWFGDGGRVECPVFDRYRLAAGHAYAGACFVEERETTTVVGLGGRLAVNDYGMLVIDVA